MYRIARGFTAANLEMQTGPIHPTRFSDLAHDIAPLHRLAIFDQIAVMVRINGRETVGVFQNHHLAITAQIITKDDTPGCCRAYG
jgi:hypothetical protein